MPGFVGQKRIYSPRGKFAITVDDEIFKSLETPEKPTYFARVIREG